ncbi:MAG: LemA family protein [Chryseolinea sp.]
MRICHASILALCTALAFNCSSPADPARHAAKGDLVKGSYIAYQDSLVDCWNIMISDDNHKIIAMQNLLQELMATSGGNAEQLERFAEQLDQLRRIRYTQNSMANSDVIEEYDFATTSLVQELVALAESRTDFGHNLNLQKLVDEIRLADERVNNYRAEYDEIVSKYNHFIALNKPYLRDISRDSLKQKHLFQMVSVE